MRVFPLLKTDTEAGARAASSIDARQNSARPDGSRRRRRHHPVPAFLPNPVTGKEVSYPSGARVAARDRLLPPLPARAPAAASGTMDARVAEAARKLAVSKAYDGAMNITAAYTHYIDDGQWTSIGAIFAEHGGKEVPYTISVPSASRTGRARRRRSNDEPGGGAGRLLQPVITVASDGRSAKMRTGCSTPAPASTPAAASKRDIPQPGRPGKSVWKLWSV